MWQNRTNAFLGVIVIVVAFLDLEGVTLTWTLGILGTLILVVGFLGGTSLDETTTTQA